MDLAVVGPVLALAAWPAAPYRDLDYGAAHEIAESPQLPDQGGPLLFQSRSVPLGQHESRT
jgi:hypothetical protein